MSDNFDARPYDAYMAGGKAFIVVKLDTKNPIEIGSFVSEFTSVASQYDKFIRQNYPALASNAQIFVKQVKRGSIIIELLPFLQTFFGSHDVGSTLEQINAVNEFVKTYKTKLTPYLNGRQGDGVARSDLKDFLGTVEAIANDPDGKASIESAVFEDGKRKVRAGIKFNTKQAVRAQKQIEAHLKRLELRDSADFARALMVFTRADINDAPVGKRTGERVRIEQVSDQDLPLVYASDLAEQKIKHEIREADDNLFKKGFYVDVNVETLGGRPVAYRVTNLHQVIDLPEEEVVAPPKDQELEH